MGIVGWVTDAYSWTHSRTISGGTLYASFESLESNLLTEGAEYTDHASETYILHRDGTVEAKDGTDDFAGYHGNSNNWRVAFSNLPEMEKVGNTYYLYTYEVSEVSLTVDGKTERVENNQTDRYSVSVSGGTITNTRKTGDLSVSKTVIGSAADKTKEFTFTVTLSDTTVSGTFGDMTFENGVAAFTLADGGTKTATGLPAGVTYTVEETDADGFTVTSTGATGAINATAAAAAAFTNTRTTEATVIKVWNDSDSSSRPASLEVRLSNGSETVETVTLNEDNEWTATVEDLPVFDDEGHELTYTWSETVPEGYVLTNAGTTGTVTTLENSLPANPTTSLGGEKTWNDNENKFSTRPESLTLVLYRDGKATTTRVTTDAEKEWKYEFADLPVFAPDGHAYAYSVKELTPANYTGVYETAAEAVTGETHSETKYTACAHQTVTLDKADDLGFVIAERADGTFLVWTQRTPTAEEKTTLNGIGAAQITGYSAETAAFVTGAHYEEGASGARALIDVSGSAFYVNFEAANVWSAYVCGTVKTPAVSHNFTNTLKTVPLEISKTVDSPADADMTRDFRFRITLDMPGTDDIDYVGVRTKADGTTEDNVRVTFKKEGEDTVYASPITLKHGETLSIAGLPAGVAYTVTEILTAEDAKDFTATVSGVTGEGTATGGTLREIKRTVTDGEGNPVIDPETGDYVTETVPNSVSFTNTRKLGDLQITKAVTVNGDAVTEDNKNLADGTYTFNVFVYGEEDPETHVKPLVPATKADGTPIGDVTVTITDGAASSTLVEDLLLGTYVVKEVGGDNPNVTLVTDPVEVEVDSKSEPDLGQETVQVPTAGFTNNLSTTDVTVTKQWQDETGTAQTEWPEGKEITLTVIRKRKAKAEGEESFTYTLDVSFALTYTVAKGESGLVITPADGNPTDAPALTPVEGTTFKFRITGLMESTQKPDEIYEYFIQETSSPEGYMPPVYQDADGNPIPDGAANSGAAPNGGVIVNKIAAYSLPNTGGAGTASLTLAGAVLAAGATLGLGAQLLGKKKRRRFAGDGEAAPKGGESRT